MTLPGYHQEPFTAEETARLEPFFTNTTGPVFALVNLPEVVKGALFARYSRSPKSLRRLFLDEFSGDAAAAIGAAPPPADDAARLARAEDLYTKVFTQYGDDSVAQLGSMHLACEQASNVLTKVLEWGRLASYLEQSTRYMYYDEPLGGRFRYLVPPEVEAIPPLAMRFRTTLDGMFRTYGDLTRTLVAYYETLHPKAETDSAFVYRSTIRARVCDDLRGLLPAATISNVGIHGSGQAFEMLLLRMRAHPLAEVRHYADLMLTELRQVAPAFLRRVDVAERGGDWTRYLEETAHQMAALAAPLDTTTPPDRPEVTLVEWDPEGETKVAAAALYAFTAQPDDLLLERVRQMSPGERERLLVMYAGDRRNRRHKPGRAFERTGYRFDVMCDYGIFRDLQRHRLLTIEWQRLGTGLGYDLPAAVSEVGAAGRWDQAMAEAAELTDVVTTAVNPDVGQYAVPLAYRIRFVMQLNAREAMHLLELRTAAGGHPGYRRVCQEMHRLIADQAGHRAIAAAMSFVDHTDPGLGRLEGERKAAARRAAAGVVEPTE